MVPWVLDCAVFTYVHESTWESISIIIIKKHPHNLLIHATSLANLNRSDGQCSKKTIEDGFRLGFRFSIDHPDEHDDGCLRCCS